MQIKTFVLALWLVFIYPSQFIFAQQKGAPASLEAPLAKTLLWEIKGKGIKTSYLFGTVHIIPSEDFFWTPATLKTLHKSKQLIMEMDMSNVFAMAMEMMTLAPMKGDTTLEDLLPAEDYQYIKTYFEENGGAQTMDFETLESWKPMLLQMQLLQNADSPIKNKPMKMYEFELLALAKEKKMAIGGLETVADQMSVFEGIPYKDQAMALLDAIRQKEQPDTAATKGKDPTAEIYQCYIDQDIEKMIEMTDDEFDEMANAEELLLIRRNNNWIPKIGKLAAKKTTFFAVGAAHLAGEQGVIKLLIKAGYTLTPLF